MSSKKLKQHRPHHERGQAGSSRGRGSRIGAVLATAGIAAAGAGSVAYDLGGGDGSEARLDPLAPASVPAAQERSSLICPPLPGRPDGIAENGILDYQERHESAAGALQALLMPGTDPGSAQPLLPDLEWTELTHEGAAEAEVLHEAPVEELNEEETPDGPAEPELFHHLEEAPVSPSLFSLGSVPGSSDFATASALYEYHAEEGPVTGLALNDCGSAERHQWFFGPETGAGASSLLTLSNPQDRPSTVEVTSYGGDGHRGGSGTRTLVVPPESYRTVNIAAISGSESYLGVEVTASGAPVLAQLQSSRAVGAAGVGTELLPSQNQARSQHLIPAVPMPDSTGEEGERAQLWLHAPGTNRTTVELQVFGPEGQVPLENAAVFTIEPGEIDAVEIEGLGAGNYSLRVNSEEPIYAGVSTRGMLENPEEEAADFSWAVGAPPVEQGHGTLLPSIGESEIRIFSASGGDGSVPYYTVDESGELSGLQEVQLQGEEPGVISASDLEDAVAVIFDEPSGDVDQASAALLTTDDDGRFSIHAVGPLTEEGQTVPVFIRE